MFFLVAACNKSENQGVTIEANPGEFNAVNLGNKNQNLSLSVKMKIVKYSSDSKWPPGAYMGFYQGDDRNNSIQFLIIKNNPEDDYVVAGYRLLKSGQVVEVESLANLKLNEVASVKMKISKGVAYIHLEGVDKIKVQTHLSDVRPYISVSSGAAHFNVLDP